MCRVLRRPREMVLRRWISPCEMDLSCCEMERDTEEIFEWSIALTAEDSSVSRAILGQGLAN